LKRLRIHGGGDLLLTPVVEYSGRLGRYDAA